MVGTICILKDCLKPIRKKNTNHNAKENTSKPEINLNDEQMELLYQLISPWYRIGYRDQIIHSLSGFLDKHYVSIKSSTLLIEKLAINDEEKDNRLLVLGFTYKKHPKGVSGYQYLISVLENIVDGGEKVTIVDFNYITFSHN
jgi:hypothetical protein